MMCDCDIEACGKDRSGVWPFHGWVAVFKSFANCCVSASLVLSVPVLTWPWNNIMIRFCCNCRYQMVVSVIIWSTFTSLIWRGRTCLSVCWQQACWKTSQRKNGCCAVILLISKQTCVMLLRARSCVGVCCVSRCHRCCVKEAVTEFAYHFSAVGCCLWSALSCSCWL